MTRRKNSSLKLHRNPELVEATPAAYREKGRIEQPLRSNKPAWAHPVVVGGRLYLRDMDRLLVYDVSAR